jgi:hypothetical protein
LSDIFTSIPTYKTKEELSKVIDWYIKNPEETEKVANKCREEASIFTFIKVVDEIEKFI